MRKGKHIVTDMDTVTEADFESAEWGDTITTQLSSDKLKEDHIAAGTWVDREYLRPKFSSVAAFKLHMYTLDGGQDEEHGDAVDWVRWSALFRNVAGTGTAAILHTGSQGDVSAEWYADGAEAEKVWATLEKEWNKFDNQCEGHYDDDAALTSGAGIGEPVYCDGSCNG